MAEVIDRVPAEVFPLAEFLSDEIVVRGWTTADVAIRMNGDVAKNLLIVDLVMCVHDDKLLMSDSNFKELARAFDVDEQYLRNIDETWRRWPDRRAGFTPPESIFGPISRRALIHVVK